MRTFFVFDIREEYLALYYNYEISLYNLLKQVYTIKKDNIIYGKHLFYQLIKPLPKEELDRRLFITLHTKTFHIVKDVTYIYIITSTYQK